MNRGSLSYDLCIKLNIVTILGLVQNVMPNNSIDSTEFILYGGPALQALLMFPEKFTPVLLWTLYVPESFCQKVHSHTFFGFDTRTQKGKEVMKERKSLKREIKIFTMRQQRVIKAEFCLLEKLGTKKPGFNDYLYHTLIWLVYIPQVIAPITFDWVMQI